MASISSTDSLPLYAQSGKRQKKPRCITKIIETEAGEEDVESVDLGEGIDVELLLSSSIFNEGRDDEVEHCDLLTENSHHMRLLLDLQRRRVGAARIDPSPSEIYLGISKPF